MDFKTVCIFLTSSEREPNFDKANAIKTHSPINVNNTIIIDNYTKKEYASGNVYERVSKRELNETYIINGNCYSIDGKNLPFVSIYSRGNQSLVSGYKIPNNTCSIIKYLISENYKTTNSKLVINDLHIVGNSTKPVLDESSENFQSSIELMNKNAGGYIAINVDFGVKVEANNCFITRTIIGFTLNLNSSLIINDTKIIDCWFNGIYGHKNGDVTVNTSYLKDFGGAAIHVEDEKSTVQTDSTGNIINEFPNEAKITINTNSIIENYVSGDEGYFKAYSFEILIMQLKAGFESKVSKNGWTMLKTIIDPVNKLEYEKVNLVMLMVSIEDNANKEIIDKTNNIKGAGRNMMGLGFTGNHQPMKLTALNQQEQKNYSYINSSLLLDIGLSTKLFEGTDVVAYNGNPLDPINTNFNGLLITYQPELPRFGGTVIVTGVEAKKQ